MLARYTPLRRYTPLPRPTKRIRARASKPKRGSIRDKNYLSWLHTLPCVVGKACAGRIEAHHVGRPKNDRRAIPLCSCHHRLTPDAVHTIGRRSFEVWFGISLEAAIYGLNEAYETERSPLCVKY